jgi:hypothetical protein
MRQLLEFHAAAAGPGIISNDRATYGSACGRSQQKLGRQRLKKVSCSDLAHDAKTQHVSGADGRRRVKSAIRTGKAAAVRDSTDMAQSRIPEETPKRSGACTLRILSVHKRTIPSAQHETARREQR